MRPWAKAVMKPAEFLPHLTQEEETPAALAVKRKYATTLHEK